MEGKNAEKATTLELYKKFLDNPEDSDLTKDQLNQIISMHGFEKLHHSKKKEILEALTSIELLVPRSTLKENITTAFLHPETMIEDLISLQWHESSVQAVEIIGWNQTLSNFLSPEKIMEEIVSLQRPECSVKSLEKIGWNPELSDSPSVEKLLSDSASVADTAMLTPPASSGTITMAMLFADGIFCAIYSKSVLCNSVPFVTPAPSVATLVRADYMSEGGKFVHLPGGVIMLYSGYHSRIDLLTTDLNRRLDEYILKFGMAIDLLAVARLAAEILNSHEHIYNECPFGGIFVGISYHLHKPSIFGVLKVGAVFEVHEGQNFMMMGSGAAKLNEDVMRPRSDPSLINEQFADYICKQVVAAAIDKNPEFCGGRTWILKLSANGVEGPFSAQD